MIEIDGSFGEGGGQILRTALTLASVTGEAVHFTDIRKNRRKPGLMYQHLTCAKAVAEITGGVLNGAELNSQEMIFTPGSIAPGNYHFVVGTAGSAILVAQTVLPCLLFGYEKSKVEICGGTHVANAPIFDFSSQSTCHVCNAWELRRLLRWIKSDFIPLAEGRSPLIFHRCGSGRNWRS